MAFPIVVSRATKGRNLLLAGLLSMVLLFSTPLVVMAISVPSSGPHVLQVDMYRHLLEDDDILVHIRYNWPYNVGPPDTAPSETIVQSAFVRLLNGTTELTSNTIYSYYRRGWGYGSASMYLDAVSAAGLWGTGLTVELRGSPTLDWYRLNDTTTMTMLGALAYDAPVYTDETTQANSVAANDMTLLPAAPAVGDAYYFGNVCPFSALKVNVGTNGVWAGTYTWEYWNGVSWMAVSSLVDESNGFTASTGNKNITFTRPTTWVKSTASGIEAYWLRFRVATFTSITTQPKGTQSWTNGEEYIPQASTTTLNWYASASQGVARLTAYSHLLSWASTLGDYWNITLVQTSTGGDKLSSYGEAYFTSAIPNLRLMVPMLFSAYIETPQYTDTEFLGEIMFSGTVGSGTATTLRDVALTQADDYWNNVTLRVLTTTDGLAPQGETALVTNFVAVNDELQFAALTAVVGAGDTYKLWMETGEDVVEESSPLDFSGLSTYFGMPSVGEALKSLLAFAIITIICGVMVSKGVPVPHTTLAGFGLVVVFAAPGPQHLINVVLLGGVVFVLVLLAGMVFLLRRA